MTVRDGANHCLFSAKTFANGGTFDAARSADAERLLALAAAAPELLAALETAVEWLEAAQADQPDDWEDPAMDAAVESARVAIAKAKGGDL